MSTLKSDNIEGNGGVIRNGKPAIELKSGAPLNVQGDFEMDAEGELVLPKGSEADRPSSPSNGQVRYSTEESAVEAYANGEWITITSPPATTTPGTNEETPVESCYTLKNTHNVTDNGYYWVDSSGTSTLTYCFMDAPWGEPDYYIFTPWGGNWSSPGYSRRYGWYHADNARPGNMDRTQDVTNPGKEWFDYNCDYCTQSRRTYRYEVPSGHVVHWYGARSHCGGDQTFGYPGMSNSCSNNPGNYACNQVFDFTGNTTTSIGFKQRNDNCGDPNEATIVGVSKVQGTTRPAPGINTWKAYFRDVSWNNGGTNNQNG